jgi:dUTP pyrophosphatase
MVVKIKKLVENAVIPKYSKPGDAGLDLTAVSVSFEKNYVSYKTGLAVEIPEGFVGLLFPRSSNSKMDLILTNSVGVIDSGYRGEIELRYKLVGNGVTPSIVGTYNIGDRVGQLVIIPYPSIEFEEVTELSTTERNTGGYGSTGN